jgi:hypothetical protein
MRDGGYCPHTTSASWEEIRSFRSVYAAEDGGHRSLPFHYYTPTHDGLGGMRYSRSNSGI